MCHQVVSVFKVVFVPPPLFFGNVAARLRSLTAEGRPSRVLHAWSCPVSGGSSGLSQMAKLTSGTVTANRN